MAIYDQWKRADGSFTPMFSEDIDLVSEWSDDRVVATHFKNSRVRVITERAFAAVEYVLQSRNLSYEVLEDTPDTAFMYKEGEFIRAITIK